MISYNGGVNVEAFLGLSFLAAAFFVIHLRISNPTDQQLENVTGKNVGV